MKLSLPTSPPLIDNFDADHRLQESEECLRKAIQELQFCQCHVAALHHHSSSKCPLCYHGLDESCVAHAIGNLCQMFLLSYGLRIGIDILFRTFKLVRRLPVLLLPP